MAGEDDWDDFSEDDPTRTAEPIPDALLVETGKHRSGEFLAGRESGFSDGVNATIQALVRKMKMDGATDADVALTTGTVRAWAEELG